MKKEQKLILAVFSVCIVIFFGYWIFFSSFTPANSNTSANFSGEKTQSQSNTQNLIDKYHFQLNNGENNGKFATTSVESSKSLTDIVAQDLSDQFLSNIKSGASTSSFDNIGLSPETFQKIISDSLAALNSLPKRSELVISSDSSSAAAKKYLNSTISLLANHFNGLPANFNDKAIVDIFEKNDFSSAKEVLKANDELVTLLENIPVPEKYVDLHRKVIAQIKGISFAYNALINYREDPFRLLSLQDYLTTMEQRVSALIKELLSERSRMG